MEDRSGRAGRVTYKKNAMDDFFFFIHFPFPRQKETERNVQEQDQETGWSCLVVVPERLQRKGRGEGGGIE